ncbi:hypothetical protein MA16_Dca012701 [Dendrobium catenatum]|uniref:Uncharacterized protein n=1 Tax=Dendrobium catenatum TaxID=906689 RepID=A0A2I0WPN3_9ASPA|nr:hypothetical protein MA16_Dca012701 [Dendrobium catenatum]
MDDISRKDRSVTTRPDPGRIPLAPGRDKTFISRIWLWNLVPTVVGGQLKLKEPQSAGDGGQKRQRGSRSSHPRHYFLIFHISYQRISILPNRTPPYLSSFLTCSGGPRERGSRRFRHTYNGVTASPPRGLRESDNRPRPTRNADSDPMPEIPIQFSHSPGVRFSYKAEGSSARWHRIPPFLFVFPPLLLEVARRSVFAA